MTFNQWCAQHRVDGPIRSALEAVWDAMIGGGNSQSQAARLLTDVIEAQIIPEREEDEW